jgi:hypothetical protein
MSKQIRVHICTRGKEGEIANSLQVIDLSCWTDTQIYILRELETRSKSLSLNPNKDKPFISIEEIL